jgi:tRNA pseudouridine38-40 synthase
MVAKVRFVVAYEGTRYSGWQLQAGDPTVQEAMEQAVQAIEGKPVRVLGASRTDQGVHALGQVAWADTERPLAPERYRAALNHFLPADIRVRLCDLPDAEFRPLKGVIEKTYVYRIDLAEVPDPLLRRIALHRPGPMDVPAMRTAIATLLGTHDFAAFGGAGSPRRSTVRTIREVQVLEEGQGIEVRLTADGFLYHMVRHIVGLLISVGQGRAELPSLGKVLVDGPPPHGLPLAPAHGLTLLGIAYGPPNPLDSRHVR